MDVDVAHVVGAVTREVASRMHEGKPARVVVATRSYDTDPDDLWDALTSPRRIPRWFLPVTGDLRLGGRYQLQGNAGGEITTCDPPRTLGITWEFGGQVSWVEVRLTSRGDGTTELVLEHVAHVPEEFWDEYGPGAVGVGWDLALLGLDRHVAHPEVAIDQKDAQEWAVSPEGQSFTRALSADWCRASIAAGTEAGRAEAAAARTTAFYGA